MSTHPYKRKKNIKKIVCCEESGRAAAAMSEREKNERKMFWKMV